MNKKILCVLFSIVISFNLCACGSVSKESENDDKKDKKAVFENTSSVDKTAASKEQMKIAYTELTSASVKLQIIADSIQGAWHYGIYEDDKTLMNFCDSTGLSETEVTDVFKGTDLESYNLYNKVYASEVFKDFNSCVSVASLVMTKNGTYDEAKQSIENAKTALQSVTDDLDYYKDMKNYYSSCLAYYEWLESPTGNFDQATDTINDYNNELKEYKNDMEFDYG